MGNASLKCFNAVLFCAWNPCLVFTLNNFYVKVKSTLPLNIESLMETGKEITHCCDTYRKVIIMRNIVNILTFFNTQKTIHLMESII